MTDDRKVVRVQLFDWSPGDMEDINQPMSEFIAELSAMLEKVPTEWRDSVRVVGEDNGWDESRVSLSAFYDRPETDEEFAARKKREAAEEAHRAARQVQNEIAMLRALQAKYGAA